MASFSIRMLLDALTFSVRTLLRQFPSNHTRAYTHTRTHMSFWLLHGSDFENNLSDEESVAKVESVGFDT